MRNQRGTIRRSQAITTFGVGALVDLPHHSAVVGGLDEWPHTLDDEISEPRLAEKLRRLTGGPPPRLIAPPAAPEAPWESGRGIPAYLFPTWFVERQPEDRTGSEPQRERRSRRLVSRKALDQKLRLERRPVVATRFVRACPRGHVDDLDWYRFVHKPSDPCLGELRLDESGTTGDLSELIVRCSCGAQRVFAEAKLVGTLGPCSGQRPWLGTHAREACEEHARLLIRTATNAWFPQIVSVLSLPDRGSELDRVVADLWGVLQRVEKKKQLKQVVALVPAVAAGLAGFRNRDILEAIRQRRSPQSAERPVKQVELDAILDAPEGFGDDIPVDPDFHARRLPARIWQRSGGRSDGRVAAVVQVHRLREVMALAGFTRFEAVTRNIDGEYESDVERAALALDASWFPAVENRGEGVFVQLAADAVREWFARPAVAERLDLLATGQERWNEGRKKPRVFPGGPYVLLHTLAHLLIQSVAMRCGYPAASIRERIYVDETAERYGVLLYTASADAEGTLGGLVEQARWTCDHLEVALDTAALCSNDPVCAHHEPGASREERWLHGAACHGCTLVAETSCEMQNDYLDRALVAPVIGCADAAFFRP